MSAYLVDPYHIGRLAAFLVRKVVGPTGEGRGYFEHHLGPMPATEFGPAIAQIWAEWNLASVKERYPDGANVGGVTGRIDLPGPVWIETEADYILECRAAARKRFGDDHSTVEMFDACDGLEYQCCEFDGWEGHAGFRWLNRLRKELSRRLPRPEGVNGWELTPRRAASDEAYIARAKREREEERDRLTPQRHLQLV